MREQGVGEHAQALLNGPVATIKHQEASADDRACAIRLLGSEGFTIGAEALIDIVRRGPSDLAAEAVWALESISGQPFGADADRWVTWRASLPA